MDVSRESVSSQRDSSKWSPKREKSDSLGLGVWYAPQFWQKDVEGWWGGW